MIRNSVFAAAVAAASFACSSGGTETAPASNIMSQALLVATTDGQLLSFNAADGTTRPGSLTQVLGPVDLQALPNGFVGVSLSGSNQVLFAEAETMLESARFPSSFTTGTRPVHSYISPARNGKQYWLSLNDGDGTLPTNSALFTGIEKTRGDWLKPVGEVALGVGHHKAAFSSIRERVVISNIGDCNKVFQIFDYSDPSSIQEIKSWSCADLGMARVTPHGCATASGSGRVYCNMTATGEIASIDVDAAAPSLTRIAPPLGGTGAGASMAHPGGRYVFTAHNSPREGAGGAPNQIGSLTVVDGQNDTATDIPLFYDGAGSTRALAGTDEEGTGISHVSVSADGTRLFVIPGSAAATTARARRVLVVDATNPAKAVQLASITVGASHGDNSDALSGDGKLLFVTNNAETTVSAIDVASLQVVRTFDTHGGSPKVVATFGTLEGSSKPVH
ncbi:MAG: YncE family protein [Myxococcales bacterium]